MIWKGGASPPIGDMQPGGVLIVTADILVILECQLPSQFPVYPNLFVFSPT